MEILEKEVIALFREEHEDWVEHIQEAEKKDGEVDINLGGSFAIRVEKILEALRNFRKRHEKKGKGLWGR